MRLLGLLAILSLGQFSTLRAAPIDPTRALIVHGPWAHKAARNLSAWRSNLFQSVQAAIVAQGNTDRVDGWRRFDPFMPFMSCPPDRPLRRVGSGGDGGKWLCDSSNLEAPCTVLSFGSRDNFEFEEAMLRETSCSVVTLDCTSPVKTLSPSHTFLPYCIGSHEHASRRQEQGRPALMPMITYHQLLSALHVEAIPIFKLDVEGFEFPIMAEWTEQSRGLPEQIAVELHYIHTFANEADTMYTPFKGRDEYDIQDLALFLGHLANLGYGIVSKEDNTGCKQCTELTLFRVEAPLLGRPERA